MRTLGRRVSVRPSLMHGRRFSAVVRGTTSAYDLFGTFGPRHEPCDDPAAADAEAIGRDWRRVGDALRRAMGLTAETPAGGR